MTTPTGAGLACPGLDSAWPRRSRPALRGMIGTTGPASRSRSIARKPARLGMDPPGRSRRRRARRLSMVSAPLSSRRHLYSYVARIATSRWPYPKLDSRYSAGCSSGTTILSSKCLLEQGFEVVHQGEYLTDRPSPASRSEVKFRFFPILREHKSAIGCLYSVPLGGSSVLDRDNARPRPQPPLRYPKPSLGYWKAGRVARSHRGLGSQNGAHDSVTDRRA